ncbi:thiamine pyrophosphate-binding protein [Nesterenkonia marinintestina]|uniref:thiamine pyrophosphate-binding protein n=1 Tax=Nesterenkonia marinintestina TaxID=2979865 RepID=UPI0021BEEC41|nr:thiamine pyrophosphate-binding protein [Nesterenkonia sp. GX14115]
MNAQHEEVRPRTGGDLVVETLEQLGATTVFGIPGQHALGLFDALSRSDLRFVSSRVENNAAFAADGFSRATGEVGVLLLSTGPGALTSLAGLQEAYSTCVPMVVVSSQIPRSGLGGRRRGMLHELDDQAGAARSVTKAQHTVLSTSSVPGVLKRAWREATAAPQGPVWVEVPQDVLLEPTSTPASDGAASGDGAPAEPTSAPDPAVVAAAAEQLAGSSRVAVVAGGGVRRSGQAARESLRSLAERLRAPVVCSPGGNSAFPRNHPLSLGGWVEDRAVSEVLEDAETLLVVGSSLGEVTSNYYTLTPRGRIIQIDAEPRVLESNHPGLGICADAGAVLEAVDEEVARILPQGATGADWHGRSPDDVVQEADARVVARLDAQDLAAERRFMDEVRDAVPDGMQTFWDMTIAAYWAWNCWDARTGEFHSAQGAGGIGHAFGAALGGAVGLVHAERTGSGRAGSLPADGEPHTPRVLAVSGDGSAMYSIPELASARQHDVPVTWLIVDDGGYGILRDYMQAEFGAATATELSRPDFAALAESFGVPAEQVDSADEVGPALRRALSAEGPNVVVVRTVLKMWAPSHLET